MTLDYRYQCLDPSRPARREVPPGEFAAYFPDPRPLVPLLLIGPTGARLREWALLDSGTDLSVLPARLLEPLGVTPDGSRGSALGGRYIAEGANYSPGIEVVVAGSWRVTLTGHFPERPPWYPVLLGRLDFMAHFRITFDHGAGKLTLDPYEDTEVAEGSIRRGAGVAPERSPQPATAA